MFPRSCLLLAFASVPLLHAQPAALTVNPASREEVRQFYRSVYFASENVPSGWSGSYANGSAGNTTPAFKEATRLRINFYRALAGVPADIQFNATYSTKAQQAALMVSANNALDHFPPPSWTFYTATGAEAAANSNLALGTQGPASIDGYIADAGVNNTAVGHRRWLFYPQTRQMGTGDVPGESLTRPPANAIWILDTTPGGQFGATRPPTRTPEIAYPPAGYIPSHLVWPRWSFSYPGADFREATVTMTRNGQPVAVRLEPQKILANGRQLDEGEPTLVWVYDNLNSNDEVSHPRPAADTPYTVTVANVRIGGAARTFTYTVTVFDADRPGADAAPVAVSGSSALRLGTSANFSVARPTFASAFEWRTLQVTPFTKTFAGDAGLDGLLATTSAGYPVTHTLSGNAVYRLAHTAPPRARADEVLQLPGNYLVSASSSFSFRSRLAIATSSQTARVQVSTDDGASWIDIYTQAGTSAPRTSTPEFTETALNTRTLSLAAFAGRTISVRLAFTIALGGSAYLPDPANLVGWFVDDLSLVNVHTVTPDTPRRVASGNTFAYTPAQAGALALQARGVIAGAFPMEWGPVLEATASVDGATAGSYLANLSVRTAAGSGDDTLFIGFAVSGGGKRLLVRGIGPTLAAFGVDGTLADPKLELYNSAAAKIAENDNWLASDAAVFPTVGAFNLAANSRDAALVANLQPASYTAQISGANGGSGVALVELYDLAAGSGAKLTNVSARSQVGTGDNILVVGFSIAGTGPRRLLIRAVGPTLGAFGVGGTLANPKLELFSGTQRIAENDDWNAADAATFASVGAFNLNANSRDAVIVTALSAGSYTAQISGVNNTTGVALVEVYELP